MTRVQFSSILGCKASVASSIFGCGPLTVDYSHGGVVNGPSKNACLAKIKPNSRGLVVLYFYGEPSRSLDFLFNAKEVSGSQKMYQSRRLAKFRI